MDLSLQLPMLAWLVSLLANASRLLRENDAHQQKLQLEKAAAEKTSRTKSEVLANMSHELRTPLNAIIGFSDLMQNEKFGPIPERYRDYAHDIHQSGTYLLKLINEILDLSKLEAGKVELRQEEFDLSSAISFAKQVVTSQAKKSEVQLEQSITSELPLARGDEMQIRQVLINLLSNAVKFTPKGGRVSISAAHNPDDGFTILVQDTGIGMKSDQIAKAFEPFGQIESELGRETKGTGLGLPIAKRLVELHGGALTLDSVVNLGTMVKVTFPSGCCAGAR